MRHFTSSEAATIGVLQSPANAPAIKLYLNVNSSSDFTPILFLQYSYEVNMIALTNGNIVIGEDMPLKKPEKPSFLNVAFITCIV